MVFQVTPCKYAFQADIGLAKTSILPYRAQDLEYLQPVHRLMWVASEFPDTWAPPFERKNVWAQGQLSAAVCAQVAGNEINTKFWG